MIVKCAPDTVSTYSIVQQSHESLKLNLAVAPLSVSVDSCRLLARCSVRLLAHLVRWQVQVGQTKRHQVHLDKQARQRSSQAQCISATGQAMMRMMNLNVMATLVGRRTSSRLRSGRINWLTGSRYMNIIAALTVLSFS